jgi:hypothetical protein
MLADLMTFEIEIAVTQSMYPARLLISGSRVWGNFEYNSGPFPKRGRFPYCKTGSFYDRTDLLYLGTVCRSFYEGDVRCGVRKRVGLG